MEQYTGLDVSLEYTSVCIVDGSGQVLREARVLSEPGALIGWFKDHSAPMARIGLEAGPLSQWLYADMEAANLPVSLLETRHVRAAFGVCQSSCPLKLFHAASRSRSAMGSPPPVSWGSASASPRPWHPFSGRSGLSKTDPTGSRFRVLPDQRAGFLARAA